MSSVKSHAVPATAMVGQMVALVAIAQANGWSVAYSNKADLAKTLKAFGLATLPASHTNWATRSGGTINGYVVLARGEQAMVWATFTGANGKAGRMAYAGATSKGSNSYTSHTVGSGHAHLLTPAAPSKGTSKARRQATSTSKATSQATPTSEPTVPASEQATA